ncbi:stefin-3-like [Acomys russatus]|uniref:stefin-3-like n=1 Tax=Acomys russatus TaxID=60746 RepID=UPI0021E23ACF|nr:stefin-3-like [Acomys russatus]
METDSLPTVGGLSQARPATPEIQEIADKVRAQLEEKTNEKYEKYEAVEYKSQVVAGSNYFIKINVGGGRYLHVKVFRGLSGQNDDFELSGYQVNKTKDDELTYI